MYRGEKNGLRNLVSVVILVLLFCSTFKIALAQDDAKGIVLGANVARSEKDKISKMPVETYFGQPDFTTQQDQLNALNVTVYPEDSVQTFPDPSLGIGSVIRVARATPVTIIDGKKEKDIRTWSQTVKDVLVEQNIELAQDDKISPSLTTPLNVDTKIVITRVEISNVLEKEPIDFTTTKKDDPTIDQGKTKTSQAGVKGERTKTYQVKRENGEEVSRTLVDNSVTKQPVTEIILVGTKPVITVACKFNDTVLAASIKYNIDANSLCYRMMAESHGNPNSDGGQYKGLFQYEQSLWDSLSSKAGYGGASIFDATAQIYTTAYAWSHGYRGRWPNP